MDDVSPIIPETPAQASLPLPNINIPLAIDHSTTPTYICAGTVACLAMCCITGVTILRPGDNTQIIMLIVGFATTTITSLVGIIKAGSVGKDVRELHVAVNSRLSQLLLATSAQATLAENQRHIDNKSSEKSMP